MKLSRLDVTKFEPFKSYNLKKVTDSWKEDFKKQIRVKINRNKKVGFQYLPITTHTIECIGWDVMFNDEPNPVGWVPKECEEGSAVRAKILGGFFHPDAKSALVKVKCFLEGLVQIVRYELVPIP